MLANGSLVLNAGAIRDRDFGSLGLDSLNCQGTRAAREVFAGWPGYQPTPLLELRDLADELGLSKVYYKDESKRFDLASFKALGGPYAVVRLLLRQIAQAAGKTATLSDILAGHYNNSVRDITVSCATDGNHGLAVAWAARILGCRAVIFLHAGVSAMREDAIRAHGAEIRRCTGNYDDSVREAAATAAAHNWTIVSDTSYPGYRDIPADVMHGYTVMVEETYEALPDQGYPTHLFLQTGVGAMAAAVCARVWQRSGECRPFIVLADPTRAPCWYRSIENGAPTAIGGDIETIMAGLSCGEVSDLAWEILKYGADAVVAVDDRAAEDGVRRLAGGAAHTPPIVAGESGVAGLAALLAVAGNEDARQRLSLSGGSRVLLIGTEGATDAHAYERIVGQPPDAILSGTRINR